MPTLASLLHSPCCFCQVLFIYPSITDFTEKGVGMALCDILRQDCRIPPPPTRVNLS